MSTTFPKNKNYFVLTFLLTLDKLKLTILQSLQMYNTIVKLH